MEQEKKLRLDDLERKSWGAKIDTRLTKEMKHLSVDMGTPVYLLAEEALQSFISRKRKLLKRKRRKP